MKLKLDLSGGYKIRIHRIIFEFLLFATMVFFYGWLALLMILIVLAVEFTPYNKLDEKINPWYKAYIRKRQEKELADHFSGDDYDADDNDGLDDNCPRCNREYDSIDREYQICHICGHVNNPDF